MGWESTTPTEALSTAPHRYEGKCPLESESAIVTPEQERLLEAVVKASGQVRDVEEALVEHRAASRQAIAAAYAGGVSLAAIGRALGVTRQRIKRIIDGV